MQRLIIKGKKKLKGKIKISGSKNATLPILAATILSNNSEIKNDSTFISGLTPEDEIREVINYVMSKGSKKFGLIFPYNEYGLRSKKLIQDLVSKKNGEISEFVFYNSKKPDFYEVSKKIANYEQRKLKLEKKLEELKNTNTVAAEKKYKKLKNQD